MNAESNYVLNSKYSGPNTQVTPVRMYSRNKMLGAMGFKSTRNLGVDLQRNFLTFHKPHSTKDPKNEIPLSKITNVTTDLTKADKHRYFMTVQTIDGDLKFRFKRAEQFYSAMDALSAVSANSRQVYQPNDEYRRNSENYLQNRPKDTKQTRSDSKSVSSSPSSSDHEFKEEDPIKEIKRKEKLDIKRRERVEQTTEADRIRDKAMRESQDIIDKAKAAAYLREENTRKEADAAIQKMDRKAEFAVRDSKEDIEKAQNLERMAVQKAQMASEKARQMQAETDERIRRVKEEQYQDLNKAVEHMHNTSCTKTSCTTSGCQKISCNKSSCDTTYCEKAGCEKQVGCPHKH